jgi:hypothetical protein
MPVYPKSAAVHAERYASEIAAIMSQYPVQYFPVAQVKPEPEAQPQPIQPEIPETARQEIIPARRGRRKRPDTQPRLFPTGWNE